MPHMEAMFVDNIIAADGQQYLADDREDLWDKILEHIPAELDIADRLKTAWQTSDSPKQRWEQLKASLDDIIERGLGRDKLTLQRMRAKLVRKIIPQVLLRFTYPRLDIHVSKAMNHLLKSPYSVHPKTGRVCVPLDPAKADEFDPTTVPTVAQLCEEAGEHKAAVAAAEQEEVEGTPQARGPRAVGSNGEGANTSMGPSLETFWKFLSGLESDIRKRKMAAAEGECHAHTHEGGGYALGAYANEDGGHGLGGVRR